MEEVEDRLVSINSVSDFNSWSSEDLSTAFWLHLGRYQKHPNKFSRGIIIRTYLWACHADHGLSNSFYNAMKWCNFDWHKEKARDDIPEE